MSEYVLADKNSLSKIADALRNSTGQNTTYTVPELSSAAVRSISSGGGSGFVQADWNENDPDMAGYIKNRTHYTEVTETELFNQTILLNSFLEWSTTETLDFYFIEEKTYKVLWNGIEYESVAKIFTIENINLCGIGNIDYISSEGVSSNGLPFIIICDKNLINTMGASFAVLSLDESLRERDIELVISGKKEVIHPIDSKYLSNLRGQKIIKFKVINNSEDVAVELNFPISELANMDPLEIQQSFLVEWTYNETSTIFCYSFPFNVYLLSSPTAGTFSGELYYVRDDDIGRVIQKIGFVYNSQVLLAAKEEGKFSLVKTKGDPSQGGPNLITCFDSAYGGIPQEVLKSENKFTYYFTDEEILALADKIDELRAARAAQ